MKPGDLIFFDWPDKKGIRDGSPDHVAIYIGNGKFIHLKGDNEDPTKLNLDKNNVYIDGFDNSYYLDSFYEARRIIQDDGSVKN